MSVPAPHPLQSGGCEREDGPGMLEEPLDCHAGLRLCRVAGSMKGPGMLAKSHRELLRVQAGSDSMEE